ncbi:MAG: HAD family phosphatase [Verrucomicrobia bacterium]|nr:HAD family phosphatase [Verrucomicrobiota bacterium]
MKGVIFDWDGVVIDSSAQHERSWELLAEEIQKPLPPGHFKAGFGKKNQEIIPGLLRWSDDPGEIRRLGERKEELYRELVREQGVAVLPGARELLVGLQKASIPRSVGSSTPRSNLDAIFAATGLGELFSAVVCGDDVTNGKPAPDVFLLAARRLGLDPADCLVIEDAHVGIEAARHAGMKVLAVATTNPLGELQLATAAVPTLAGVTPEFLQHI